MSQPEDVRINRPSPPTCTGCGRPVVSDQLVEHRGAVYCADCVGAALETARRQQANRSGGIYISVLLSLVPGLGQMYNGQMMKGLLILAGFVFIMTGTPPFQGDLQNGAGFILYVWNLFDAYWTARRLEHEEMPVLPPPEEQQWESAATPAWGIVLIVLGLIFLLNNFGVAWLTFDRAWPAVLLALGLWLLISFALSWRAQNASREANHGETS